MATSAIAFPVNVNSPLVNEAGPSSSPHRPNISREPQTTPAPSIRVTRARTTSGNQSHLSASATMPAPPPPGPDFIQPDHFSPLNNATNPEQAARGIPKLQDGWVSPEDDPNALRGIPVFRPSMEEFQDFEAYVTKTVPWGQRSGITKIIPPAEWTTALPPISKSTLADVRIHHPIQQNLLGNAGLFRVLSVVKNKNRDLTVQEWFNKCKDGKFSGPGPKDVARAQNRDSKEAKERMAALQEETKRRKEEKRAQRQAAADRRASRVATDNGAQEQDHVQQETEDVDMNHVPHLDPSHTSPHSSPDPIATTPDSNSDSGSDRTDPWYKQFDPTVDWLPKNTKLEDYTTEACAALERHFWKNMGMGEPSWYGADMEGSLFVDEKTPWNVAHLPNLLNRWNMKSLPGVNSPYLYFGMWGATFAWHVEDMDLFSINYIHFGAPKFWYAVPQGQAEKLERVLQGYFPEESRKCDQFLRHKSFAVSPYRLANDGVHVNMLVHNQNEFVITYPRGYHAGFNMNFNCAESTNLALDSWVELGRRAKACQCVDHSVKFDVDEIMAKEGRRLNGEQELLDAIEEERRTKKSRKRPNPHDVNGSRKRPRQSDMSEDHLMGENEEADDQVIIPETKPKIPAMRKKKPKTIINLSPERAPTQPPIIQENPIYPCLLCPSLSTKDLLPVFEPSTSVQAIWKPRTGDIQAHHSCALAMPGVGIEDREVDGQSKTYIVGVENIEKGRWNLKCAECADKRLQKSGAKIQCTKGKCPKAYHVSCAENSDTALLKIWEVQTPVIPSELQAEGEGDQGQGALEMSTEIKVELLCSSHNPDMKERNEQRKADAFKNKVMAIPLDSSIKIKIRGGASLQYTLIANREDTQQVVVADSADGQFIYPWSSIDFRPAQAALMENEYARHHTHVRRTTDIPSNAPFAQRSGPLRVNDLLNPQDDTIPTRVVLCDSIAYPPALFPSANVNSNSHPTRYPYTSYSHSDASTSNIRIHPPLYDVGPRVRPISTCPILPRNPLMLQAGPSRGAAGQIISMPVQSSSSYPATNSHTTSTFVPSTSQLQQMSNGKASAPGHGNLSNNGVGKIDLGLDRMNRILGLLPPLTVPAIHIAGTNGKGSVSAIIESCLMSSGMRVARYNSPHFVEPRDAIRINGVPPSSGEYSAAMAAVGNLNQTFRILASTFEISTAAAYHLINTTQPPVDVMIIECGMGGARDATNVIPDELTLASALTSVGLDHTAFLGDTISKIAREKSEIAVRDGLLVVGLQTHQEAVEAAKIVAAEKGARIVQAYRSEIIAQESSNDARVVMSLEPFRLPGPTLVRTTLPSTPSSSINGVTPEHSVETEFYLGGKHQIDNLSLALSILHSIRIDYRARRIQPKLESVSVGAIQKGVRSTRWEGRCSWLQWKDPKTQTNKSYPILVDGAHNSDSAKTLRNYINQLDFENGPKTKTRTKFVISLSSSQGKTIESVLKPLLSKGDQVEIVNFNTPIEGMPWISPTDKNEMLNVAQNLVGDQGIVSTGGDGPDGIEDALRNLTKDNNKEQGLLVVCGSLYLVADTYRLLARGY